MAATTAVAFAAGRHRLIELVKPPMRERGFQHLKELSFGRSHPRAVQLISFGSRAGTRGEFCFSFGAGVRFPEVETLLRPDGDDDLTATVAMPLSVLRAAPAFPEWCFNGDREPVDVISEVVVNVDEYALPFLHRYLSMEEVERSLRSADPRSWFVLTPEQRLMTLAALEHIQARRADALQLLDAAIAELKDAPMKKRWPLESLRGRLKSATD